MSSLSVERSQSRYPATRSASLSEATSSRRSVGIRRRHSAHVVGANLAEYADIASDTVESTLADWPDKGRIDLHEELSVLTTRVITRSLFSQDTVRETLRLTPAAWNITRQARADTTVAGTDVAAGDLMMMPTYARHRDSRVWQDPETFRPDRWEGDVSRGSDSYFPFGSGPRVCIGKQIALTEAQFTFAHVLQHYDVTLEHERLGLQPGVTLRPDGPVRATVEAL